MLDVENANAAAASTSVGRLGGGGGGCGGAVRCLFGPPDVEGTRQFLHEEMRKIQEKQTRRWNFDFNEGRPLRGRYRWEPYPSGEAQSSSGATHSAQPRDASAAAAAACAAGKQLTITDYFPKRKRLAGSDIATPKAVCCAARGETMLVRPLAVRASDRPPVLVSAVTPSSPPLSQSPSDDN